MNNPLSLTKQTRQRYDKQLERVLTEVEINIEGVPKAWIPLETFIALTNLAK